MKQSTLDNIKQTVNQLIKNNIKLTTEVLSKEAHTSKRTVTEFFNMFPKESFNKYYENGTVASSTILKDADKNGTDSNTTENGTVQNGTTENGTDSNPVENGTTKNGTEEVYNVMTDEGFINQLNRLFTKGVIDKKYYMKQVDVLKNNYPLSFFRIKEKILMDI